MLSKTRRSSAEPPTTCALIASPTLAFAETCVRDLRAMARLESIEQDVREERFVVHTLQLAIQAVLDAASHVVSDERLGEPQTNNLTNGTAYVVAGGPGLPSGTQGIGSIYDLRVQGMSGDDLMGSMVVGAGDVDLDGAALLLERDAAARRLEDAERARAEEGVSPDLLPPHDRFEEEPVRVGGDLRERAHGGEHITQQRPIDGDDVPLLRELLELFERRVIHAPSHTAGNPKRESNYSSSLAGLQPAAVSSATGFSRWARLRTAVSRLQPGLPAFGGLLDG
jgi:hypothetical protein